MNTSSRHKKFKYNELPIIFKMFYSISNIVVRNYSLGNPNYDFVVVTKSKTQIQLRVKKQFIGFTESRNQSSIKISKSDVLAHRAMIRENRSPAEEGTIRASPKQVTENTLEAEERTNRGGRENELTKDRERATQI